MSISKILIPTEATTAARPLRQSQNAWCAKRTQAIYPRGSVVFDKILVANRGDNGRQAAAAKPKRMVREAHAGDLPAGLRRV